MSSLSPVWLYTGPEIGERNTAIEQLRISAARSGVLDSHTFYVSDVRIGDIISLLQNGSLFADSRFIVLRNAELIKKKEDVEQIISWISESTNVTDATLILVSDDNSIDKKIENCVPKEHRKIFWEMFENRKEQWITDFFRKAGYRIEGDAIASILDLVENNTEALKAACSGFLLFFSKDHIITEDDTLEILAHNREESPFSLFDVLTEGNLAGALDIQRKLSMSKESSPVQTIAGLTWCFRRLEDWHRLMLSGETDDFSLKKAGFSAKRAVEQYKRAARRWNPASTVQILALLASTDVALRSGGTAIQDYQMELCLYSIVKKNGQAAEVITSM